LGLAAAGWACRASGDVPPVLTLVPAAMVHAGPARRAGPYELCLGPGGRAVASIYVHERTLVLSVRARSEDPVRDAQLWLRVEGEFVTPQPIRFRELRLAAYRLRAVPGRRTLEVAVPSTSAAGACVGEVSLTQP